MDGRPRTWPWIATAVLGTLMFAAGPWLLLGPMHAPQGASCGSAVRMRFAANDDPLVYFCGQAQRWRLADGWPLVVVGAAAALLAGARLAVLRSERWLWA